MDRLPYIDEHRQRVQGSPDEVWGAVLKVLRRAMSGSTRFAGLLGCDPRSTSADFQGRPGDTVPGFRVVNAEPGRRLVLQGRHRFSSYELTFHLDGDELCAESRGAFPGVLGWLYRTAVIGTGGHRIITRGLLKQIARAI
jgi:hypothetical protein